MTTTNPARDWELTCHKCDGSGHVYVKHQVAERKTDVQEFKEECECCQGRGFVFAFQDIPGIEQYVKASRPAPGVSTVEDAQDERQAFEAWAVEVGYQSDELARCKIGVVSPEYFNLNTENAWKAWQERARMDAPAAGDAQDAARYRWLCDKFGITKLPCAIERIIEGSYVADGKAAIDAAIDTAIAAQQGKGGAA